LPVTPFHFGPGLALKAVAAPVFSWSALGVLSGGLAGGLSHPLLDGIMHADLRPFMPWSDVNPFLGLIGLAQLHLACVAAAIAGAVCLTLWRRRLPPAQGAGTTEHGHREHRGSQPRSAPR
jgi:membrane-bound metal-dependent hydrolase YbcI (DUF457 family)